MNRRPLDVALPAQRLIPTDREELEIERLISADQRRVTIEDHAAFRESIAEPQAGDELDELVAELREIEAEKGGIRTP